jgi:hypothetical protein
MKTLFETDLINSATPLETRYAGVHPRLYATDERIAEIRRQLGREPWDGFLRRLEAVAERAITTGVPLPNSAGDVRGAGCGLVHLAVAYRFTAKPEYLAAARDHAARMAAQADWGCSLQYGHWAHGMAVAYDWLQAELDEPLRQTLRQTLRDRTERVVALWVSYANAYPTTYAWNHMAVVHGGVMAAGCALWGEVEGAGRWLRMAMEKMRLMVEALGPDGASAEGLAYGQYHIDFLLKAMILTDQLLGVDLFEDCLFLRRYPLFLLYSMLPRQAWVPGAPDQRYMSKAFVSLGDSEGAHWYGPDSHLNLVAGRYGDTCAQWLAKQAGEAGINGESSAYLNLLFHDETVAAESPDALPTLRHFEDKDIVVLRGGWGDQAAVMAIKCGPNSGYHAARHYRHNIGGGHMHPDAGHVVLHACGSWLLVDDGYTRKSTAYQNTVLVNGIGQTGEGGDWFEDLEMRRGKPEGRIIQARPGTRMDWVIADAAAAYKPEARLRRFVRHLLYLKPDVWVLVDELESEIPSRFEVRFHVPCAFKAAGEGFWTMSAEPGALALWALGTVPVAGRIIRDQLLGIGGRPKGELDALAIANTTPRRAALFVTVLHAHPSKSAPQVRVQWEQEPDVGWLHVGRALQVVRLGIRSGQSDPTRSIIVEE